MGCPCRILSSITRVDSLTFENIIYELGDMHNDSGVRCLGPRARFMGLSLRSFKRASI